MNRLFVYGTLMPGRANHHLIEHLLGKWEEASCTGILVRDGWGDAMGYPAIIPDPKGKDVLGYVLSSEQLKDNWAMLDEFEGDGYKRVVVSVTLKSGNTLDAFVYALNTEQNTDA